MKGKDLKPHIGIFGRRNFGKSSLINLLVGHDVAIVSEHPGTTTDPVKKSVEIFGIGPAIIIDTAGIDDTGELGKKRVDKTIKVIPTIDAAILVIARNLFSDYETFIINKLNEYEIPYLIIHNKSDIEKIKPGTIGKIKDFSQAEIFDFNIFEKDNLNDIISVLEKIVPENSYQNISLFEGLVKPKDIVLLITPIDSEAPVGRMILPQVMALRDALDNDCICVIVKETGLVDFLKTGVKPVLAVTDSQAFSYVSSIVPKDINLTSFSIVFARLRGNFEKYLEGTVKISQLKDGDSVLILESCTHQVSCDDIGRYKIPSWLEKFSGKKLSFEIVPGLSQPSKDIRKYSLVIQCGGCVVTKKQMQGRLKAAIDANIPVTNYGMAIAYINGIFERVIAPFTEIKKVEIKEEAL